MPAIDSGASCPDLLSRAANTYPQSHALAASHRASHPADCHPVCPGATRFTFVRSCLGQAQPTPGRPGLQRPDNLLAFRHSTGRNVTLKRLVAEAWHCQLNQVLGPSWLDQNEYDIAARAPEDASREQISLMLRKLLTDRFQLKRHDASSPDARVRVADRPRWPQNPSGSEPEALQRSQDLDFTSAATCGSFADLLAIQFSIPAPSSPGVPVKAGGAATPVLDKTGLEGIYDFSVDLPSRTGH